MWIACSPGGRFLPTSLILTPLPSRDDHSVAVASVWPSGLFSSTFVEAAPALAASARLAPKTRIVETKVFMSTSTARKLAWRRPLRKGRSLEKLPQDHDLADEPDEEHSRARIDDSPDVRRGVCHARPEEDRRAERGRRVGVAAHVRDQDEDRKDRQV